MCPDNCALGKLPLIRVRVRVGGQFSSGAIVLEPHTAVKDLILAVSSVNMVKSYGLQKKYEHFPVFMTKKTRGRKENWKKTAWFGGGVYLN